MSREATFNRWIDTLDSLPIGYPCLRFSFGAEKVLEGPPFVEEGGQIRELDAYAMILVHFFA